MSQPTGEDKNRGRTLVLALIAAPILYVLSAGPAVLIIEAFPATYKTIGFIFTPIDLLYRAAPPLRKPLDAYFRLWRHPTPYRVPPP